MASIVQRRWKNQWETLNPVLLNGEIGQEINTGKLKIGDGRTPWNTLTFLPMGNVVIGDGEVDLSAYATTQALNDAVNARVPESTFIERLQDAVAALIVAGANITTTYDDAGNRLTITSTASGGGGTTDPEVVRDTIAAALVQGTGVSIVTNDAADTITISVTGLDSKVDSEQVNSMITAKATELQASIDEKVSTAAITPADVYTKADVYNKTETDTAVNNRLGPSDITPLDGLAVLALNVAVAFKSGGADVTWKLPTVVDNVTGWDVRYRPTSPANSAWQTGAQVASTVVAASISGLTNGTAYEIDVVPRNSVKGTPEATTTVVGGDSFNGGTVTWDSATPRSSNLGTAQTWVVDTSSTQTPKFEFRIYDGIVQPSAGNAVTSAHLAGGSEAGRKFRWKWSALNTDLTKRRAAMTFRAAADGTSVTNTWFVSNESTNGYYTVGKIVGGTVTTVFSSTTVRSVADVVDVVLDDVTNRITVLINGVQLWQSVETDLAANVRYGIRVQAQASGATYSQDQSSKLDYLNKLVTA